MSLPQWMSPLILVSTLSITGFVPLTTLQAADETWDRFRGPNGTGLLERGTLPERLQKEENVRFRTPLPSGHSSPVLSSDKIFLTALDGETLFTYALSRDNGEVLWRREAPRPRRTPFDPRNHAAAASAAVFEDAVVVFFDEYGVLAYDHEGEELWRYPLGPFKSVYGMGASPIQCGRSVVVACDQNLGSFVVAIDVDSGERVWQTDRPYARSGHCTPILCDNKNGETEILLPGSFYLDAYDPQNGSRVWWVSGLSFEMKSVPALHEDRLFINGYASPLNQPGNQVELAPFDEVCAEHDADRNGQISKKEMPPSRASNWFDFVNLDGDDHLDRQEWNYLRSALASKNAMMAIDIGGEGDVTGSSVAWQYHRSVPQLPSPLIYGGVLYMLADSGGLLTLLDPNSGEVIEKGRLEEAMDNYYASPVGGDGKVFLVSESGIVTVLEAGGSIKALSTTQLDERCYATPALADGFLYLRTEEALYEFSVQKGS